MDIFELIKLSIKSLFSFKVRSFLTMLGVIVGIGSVVLISSIGTGFQNNLLGDLTKSLSKIVMVDIDTKKLAKRSVERDFYFTKEDLEAIEKLPNIDVAFFETQSTGIYTNEKNTENKGGIFGSEIYIGEHGIGPKNMPAYSYKVSYGRNISKEEFESNAKVAVIEYEGAKLIYGDPTSAIGKVLEYEDFDGNLKQYAIIGVTQKPEKESPITQPQATIFTVAEEKQYNQNFMFKVKDEKKLTETTDILKKYLLQKANGEDIYKITPINDQLKEVTGILDKVSLFISFIAAISLIVGGIGVMNIMLVSVTERISEIGLRKAIGAKNRHILLQFLIESIILTLIGGIVGVVFGYSLAFLVGLFLKITPILKMNVLVLSLLVSGGTGLIFGIYPAKKASRLSPMEALRSE